MNIIEDFLKIKKHLNLPEELELHIKFDWNEGFYRSEFPAVMLGVKDGYNRTLLVHECLHVKGLTHYNPPEYTGHIPSDEYSKKIEGEIFKLPL